MSLRSASLRLFLAVALAAIVALAASPNRAGVPPDTQRTRAPERLEDTGLYSDALALVVDPAHISFSPQYPLWTDGATKHRWISIPEGASIDASDPDAWSFPVGARIWKEFSFDSRRVETRYMERLADGSWLYAAYAWSADGREAVLVSERGRRNAHLFGNGRSHAIPGINDCKACHQGGRSEVLGFSALQLSGDRDPAAPHGEGESRLDLVALARSGKLVNLQKEFLSTPPRVKAASDSERAALGYLHGNCGHCHNDKGPLQNVGLFLRQTLAGDGDQPIATTFNHALKKPAPGQSPEAANRIGRRIPNAADFSSGSRPASRRCRCPRSAPSSSTTRQWRC